MWYSGVWGITPYQPPLAALTIISEVVGKEATADPNREIGFGFVSCSCRACVRAGEAKLRERVGDVILNAGGSNGNIDYCCCSGGGPGRASICCYTRWF